MNRKAAEKRGEFRASISSSAILTRVDPSQLEKRIRDGSEVTPEDFLPPEGGDSGGKQPLPPWANQLLKYLMKIDEKIDRIAAKLECPAPEATLSFPATLCNLSGSGAGFVLSERVAQGELLRISMNLPGFPLNRFEAYGKVVRIFPRGEKDKGLFDVAVKFIYISEADREQLIACSFTAQRKAIRSAGGLGSDG